MTCHSSPVVSSPYTCNVRKPTRWCARRDRAFRAATSVTVKSNSVPYRSAIVRYNPSKVPCTAIALRDADLPHHEPSRVAAKRFTVPRQRVQHLEQRTEDGHVVRKAARHDEGIAHDPSARRGDDRRGRVVHAPQNALVVAHGHEALTGDGVRRERGRQVPGLKVEDAGHILGYRDGGELDYFASGSGRSWKRTTLLVVPLPVSMWNGVRVLTVDQSPLPFQPVRGSSMRPSIHFV